MQILGTFLGQKAAEFIIKYPRHHAFPKKIPDNERIEQRMFCSQGAVGRRGVLWTIKSSPCIWRQPLTPESMTSNQNYLPKSLNKTEGRKPSNIKNILQHAVDKRRGNYGTANAKPPTAHDNHIWKKNSFLKSSLAEGMTLSRRVRSSTQELSEASLHLHQHFLALLMGNTPMLQRKAKIPPEANSTYEGENHSYLAPTSDQQNLQSRWLPENHHVTKELSLYPNIGIENHNFTYHTHCLLNQRRVILSEYPFYELIG